MNIHPRQSYSAWPAENADILNGRYTTIPSPHHRANASRSSPQGSDIRSTKRRSSQASGSGDDLESERPRKRVSPPADAEPQYCQECAKLQCRHITQALKSTKKAAKERAHRDNEAHLRQILEDVATNYIDFEFSSTLAKGNNVASGLKYPKAIIMAVAIKMWLRSQDLEFKQAIREGRVDAWKAEQRKKAEDALLEDDLLSGTLLHNPDEARCAHASSTKSRCVTHGIEDWSKCRRERSRATFLANRKAYEDQLKAEPARHTTHQRRFLHGRL